MNRSYVVNSNISLHYIPMEKLKTTTLGVYIHRKLDEREASLNAVLPYVLKSGCQLCKDTGEIARYLQNLYGAVLHSGVAKKGEDQIIFFDADTISDRYAAGGEALLDGLLELLLSIIFEPVTENGGFLADVVEREKKNAIDRINGIINDKRTYAQVRCTQEMCKGDAFAISKLGEVEEIEKITPHLLYDYYRRMITESAIDVFVCGEADIEKVSAKLKDLRFSFTKAEIPKSSILTGKREVNRIVEKMEVTQGKLSMGFKTNTGAKDEDFFALTVANSIFGAGAHSKLFNNVREKMSLCYYASSSLEKFKGLMMVNAGIEFKNFQKAYDEILVQFEAIKKGEISDFEFESSVNAILNAYQSAYDDPRSLQSFVLGEIIAETGYSIADYIKKIKEITKEDVVRVMNKVELDTVYFLTGKGEE